MNLGRLAFKPDDYKAIMDWSNKNFSDFSNLLLVERLQKEETIEIKKDGKVYIGRIVCLEEKKDDCSDSKGAYP